MLIYDVHVISSFYKHAAAFVCKLKIKCCLTKVGVLQVLVVALQSLGILRHNVMYDFVKSCLCCVLLVCVCVIKQLRASMLLFCKTLKIAVF